jgi:peptidylprolyl isomerase
MTVANFVGLAEGTIENQAFPPGRPFYDGTTFHRVAPGHVIQAGIPASQVANTPGYSIPNEIHHERGHGKEGMVGMANGGPHTGKAQFYITLGDRSYLDGDYTVFGEVVEGMEVVRQIAQGDVIERVRIVRVGAEAAGFHPTTESFRLLREEVRARVEARDSLQREADLAYLRASWPNAVTTDAGCRYVVLSPGAGASVRPGDTLVVRYNGRTVRGMSFASSGERGEPHFFMPGMEGGEPFTYVVGQSKVNPGFDRAVEAMSRGEKRLAIVPAELAYDPAGFYGRPRAWEPRFVIRPRSILVYEIEVVGG